MSNQYEKRKAKATVQDLERAVEYAEMKFERTSYDVFYDPTKRKYVRIAVEYDLETKVARVKEIKQLADSQPMAIKKMVELFTAKIFKLPIKE